MKHFFTRTVSGLLVFAMLLTAAACAENKDKPDDETKASGDESTAETTVDKYDEAKAAFASLSYDMEGADFQIMSMKSVGNAEREIYVEAQIGEPIDDAVFTRNMKIDEKFHAKIVPNPVDNGALTNTLKKSVQSGDEDLKLVFPNLDQAGGLAKEGMLLNFLDYEAFNLEKNWWDQGTRNLEIAGKVYFMSGDINFLDNDVTYILLFNKKLIADNNLTEPYDLVYDKKWTLDVFQTYIKNVSNDANGDGKFDTDDQYGYVALPGTLDSFLVGSDLKYVSFDSDGYPQLDVNVDKMATVLEKTADICTKDNWSYILGVGGGQDAIGKEMFMADRVLFYGEVLSYVVNVKEMETPFGVLPIPKYDEAQENYITYCNNISSTCAMPTMLENPDDIATITEGMALLSFIEITPAYYDISLQRKYTRDDESSNMLDIALAYRIYDVGRVFTSIGFATFFQDLAAKGSKDFASKYAKKESSALKNIDKLVSAFEKLDH